MRSIFLILFCLGITASVFGQEAPNYRYIKVPVKFDFLKEENQYQLNALTAFLFEKKGFEVVYRNNIPAGIDPCNVLQADVHSNSGLFRSRLYFTLENCSNEIVFTSETGVSREKDFKASYHDALRNAFDSLELWNENNSEPEMEVVVDPVVTSDEVDALEEQPEEIIVDPVVTAEEIDKIDTENSPSVENRASNAISEGRKFTNGPVNYTLKPTEAGFDLYKEGSDEKFATLMKSGGGSNYIYASKNVSGNAFFDTSGNLVVEYLDPGNQQLVTIIYRVKSQ